jgi:hypothetical protein
LLSQAGPALVVAAGATATTIAARQLLCGRSRFRGEWGHAPVFLWRESCAAWPRVTALPPKTPRNRRRGSGAARRRALGAALRGPCLFSISPQAKKKMKKALHWCTRALAVYKRPPPKKRRSRGKLVPSFRAT